MASLLVVVIVACTSSSPSVHGRILLFVSADSGGPAPIMQSLAFFEDGTVRFQLAHCAAWRRLPSRDLSSLLTVLGEARPDLAALPSGRECCDMASAAFELDKSVESLGTVLPNHVLSRPFETSRSSPIGQMLVVIDRIASDKFGWRYRPIGPPA